MAIHWKIPFKSLRDKTDYCVNIYDADFSGTAVVLKGGAQPFTTKEDDNDDLFAPLRTQSGYIRIVDDGFAADGVTAFDWRDIIPQTDTDRPVTLTAGNTIVWQGYMQAQNFGSKIFGNPQEREYPVHCALSVMSREDVDVKEYCYDKIPNFACLLDYILSAVPSITIDKVIVQGGADARIWLLKKFDWSVFGDANEDGELVNNCDMQKALRDMCMYWGWCARISGTTLFLLSPDDSVLVNFLVLTRAQLTSLAEGTTTGTVDTGGYDTQTIGNVFASTDNTDMQIRGYNSAIMNADPGEVSELVYTYPKAVMVDMFNSGFSTPVDGKSYTQNTSSFTTEILEALGYEGSICLRRVYNSSIKGVIRMGFTASGGTTVQFKDILRHNYTGGYFEIKGTAASAENPYQMVASIGIIDAQPNDILFYNGTTWIAMDTDFNFLVDKGGKIDFKIPTANMNIKDGYLVFRLKGSVDGPRSQDIEDFEVTFERATDFRRFEQERISSKEYRAKNNSMVKESWSESTMFATDNYMQFAPGTVQNPDGTYFGGWNYSQHQTGTMQPEQHMVNRVASYWSASKRMITCDVRADLLTMEPKPNQKITIDTTECYPMAISRDWRNDVITLKLIEI